MRKIINSTYLTLDGAVENPHLWPSFTGGSGSDVSFRIQNDLVQQCDALLLGRSTYESFAAVWPAQAGNPVADRLNSMRKLVASTTLRDPAWNNTTVIGRDLVSEIAEIKRQPGMNIVQYGLGQVSFTLIEHGLMDEIHLWIHPLILGKLGPRTPHFLACPTTHLELLDTQAIPGDHVILRYAVRPKESH